MEESRANLPVRKYRAGAISATVWNNQAEKGEFKTVSLERGYKDREGIWKSTGTLRMHDLPKATLVLQKAYEFLALGDEAA